jgi:hypothetical protein
MYALYDKHQPSICRPAPSIIINMEFSSIRLKHIVYFIVSTHQLPSEHQQSVPYPRPESPGCHSLDRACHEDL